MNSIENDDWTEDPDEKYPLLLKETEEKDETKQHCGGKKMPWRMENYGATTKIVSSPSQYSSR